MAKEDREMRIRPGMENGMRDRAGRLHEEIGQLTILTQHFFGRLFRNDIVDFEDQMKARLAAVLSILAVIVGWSSETLLSKYAFVRDANMSWQEKNYVFCLMMIIFGIVTLLEWEMLFPDSRDFINLWPLPIRLRTLFAAKLASFVFFVGLFSTALSSISSVLFAFLLAPWRSSSPFFLVRYVFAHLVSAFAACFFVFFACVFIQFFLMAVLPVRLYRRTSPLVRFALIAVFVFFLLAFLADPSILDGSFRSLARLKHLGSPFIFRFPPLWFVGLYEVLLGTGDPIYGVLAKTAGLSLLFSLGAFFLAGALSYHRHISKTFETKKRTSRLSWLREYVSEALQKLTYWNPEERAVAGFFSKTIRSSPKHRQTLTNFAAVAAGFIIFFIAVTRSGLRDLTPGNMNLLVQPLILYAVLLMGIRIVVNIPAGADARWIFQVAESPRRTRYLSGLKKAIFLKCFLPLGVLVFLVHLPIWRDWRPALLHAVFGLIVSALGIEAFFYNFRKIPFACTHVPGKLKLQTYGVLYLMGFIIFLTVFSFIEKSLLRDPLYFVAFFAASLLIWTALRIGSNRYIKAHSLIYTEEPEPVMVTFPEEP